jgi:hypothetical protein
MAKRASRIKSLFTPIIIIRRAVWHLSLSFFFLSLSTNTEQAQHLFIYFGWLVGRRQDEKQLPR